MGFLDVLLAPWTDHPSELRELRLEMASTKDVVARLAAATDELANDLTTLRGKIAAQDSDLAAELDPIVSRLEAMGQDPQNPVPADPSSGGDVPADNSGGEVSPEDVPEQNASDGNF